MNMKAFLKESAIPVENVKYVASKRFVDPDGKPMEWELRPLSTEEFDKITDSTKTKMVTNKKGDTTVVSDGKRAKYATIIASVVEPDLKAVELQDSWGTVGEEATLKAMLLPGEITDLSDMIMQISGFDTGMADKLAEKIEEAKN